MHTFPFDTAQGLMMEAFALHNTLSVKELRDALQQDFDTIYSLPYLYKLTQRLLAQQVLVRTKGKFALNNLWVENLRHYIRQVDATATLQERPLKTLQEGQYLSFNASSLEELDPISNHLFTQLADLTAGEDWYIYHAHPYYLMGKLETEMRLYQNIIEKDGRIHLLLGNTTYLDTYGGNRIVLKDYEAKLTETPPFPKEGYSLLVAGDYVSHLLYPEAITQEFRAFFEAVKDIRQFAPAAFGDIFRMHAEYTLKLGKSPKEATMIRKAFDPYFA